MKMLTFINGNNRRQYPVAFYLSRPRYFSHTRGITARNAQGVFKKCYIENSDCIKKYVDRILKEVEDREEMGNFIELPRMDNYFSRHFYNIISSHLVPIRIYYHPVFEAFVCDVLFEVVTAEELRNAIPVVN